MSSKKEEILDIAAADNGIDKDDDSSNVENNEQPIIKVEKSKKKGLLDTVFKLVSTLYLISHTITIILKIKNYFTEGHYSLS